MTLPAARDRILALVGPGRHLAVGSAGDIYYASWSGPGGRLRVEAATWERLVAAVRRVVRP